MLKVSKNNYILQKSTKKLLSLKAHSEVWDNFWQMMKNAFYFTSKALLVLKIFKLLSWLSGHAANQLDKKD